MALVRSRVYVLFESRSFSKDITTLFPFILYSGAFSCGVAYTLQVVGQKYVRPQHAVLLLSLESVWAAIGGAIAAMYWLLMLVGRLASSAISGKVASRTQLIVASSVAICFILIAIFIPKTVTVSMPGYTVGEGFQIAQVPASALFLVLCGLCTSVMWGGIFNLAVEGLGKYTAQASGLFMMMVVGGGIFPLVQQFISDAAGYMPSYWLIIILLAYLLYYSLIGCKNVNKDIPVE